MFFEMLVERISPTLERITQKLNGRFSFMDHDDLFQEALLHLWVDYQAGRLDDKTDSYVLQGCYFHLKNYIRTVQDKAPIVSLATLQDEEGTSLEELLEGDEIAAFDYVDGKMQVEALLDAGMTEREREVLGLTMEGVTTREIGSMLGISHVSVVKIRNRIRQRWQQVHGPHDPHGPGEEQSYQN